MVRARMAILCFYLALPCVAGAQLQAGQDPGLCDVIFATAEKMSRGEDADAQKNALKLYTDASRCYGPAVTQRTAITLSRIGRLQVSLSLYDDALKTLPEAETISNSLRIGTRKFRRRKPKLSAIKRLQKKMLGHFDEALSDYQKVLSRFHDLGETYFEALTLEQIGLVYALTGDADEALSNYDQATQLLERIKADDSRSPQQIAAIFDLKGRVRAQMNDFGSAMKDYKEALSRALKTEYHEFVVYTLNDIGAVQLKQNRPLQAEDSHQKALDYLKHHGSEAKAVAETQALLGTLRQRRGIDVKFRPAELSSGPGYAGRREGRDRPGRNSFFAGNA